MQNEQCSFNLSPENNTPGPNVFMQNVQRNKAVWGKYNYKFRNIFGCSLSPFMNVVTGFDVCKFDDEIIKSPDGVSCAEEIRNKYGPEAAEMIWDLIGFKKSDIDPNEQKEAEDE